MYISRSIPTLDVLENWCSRMELMDSRTEARRLWFVSLASRKLGVDIEEKSCRILVQAAGARCSTYGAMLLIIANRAG